MLTVNFHVVSSPFSVKKNTRLKYLSLFFVMVNENFGFDQPSSFWHTTSSCFGNRKLCSWNGDVYSTWVPFAQRSHSGNVRGGQELRGQDKMASWKSLRPQSPTFPYWTILPSTCCLSPRLSQQFLHLDITGIMGQITFAVETVLHCRMTSSISGLYSLDARSTPNPSLRCNYKNVSWHCPMSPEEKTCPRLSPLL